MPEIARNIELALRPHFRVFYDDSGAVGRRYRRQDEAGTPYCITVDSQTLQDQTVTVRERDSMKQERIASDASGTLLARKAGWNRPAATQLSHILRIIHAQRTLSFARAGLLWDAGRTRKQRHPLRSGAPENLKALSVNGTTVGLQWTAPSGQQDSIEGYVVQMGSSRDTLAKTTLSYLADSLTARRERTLHRLCPSHFGHLSDGAVIKWAPASRFDGPYVLSEYKTNVTTVNSAFDVGTATLEPAAMGVTSTNATRMDLYLFGGNGWVQEALQLQSTSCWPMSGTATFFSTVTHPSARPGLLSCRVPGSDRRFTLDRVPLVDNTIYYVRVIGDNGNS